MKDSDHFVDRWTLGVKYTEAKEEVEKLFGLFLFNLTGDTWKKMRSLVSPVFTSGKLKLMTPHIDKVDTMNLKTSLQSRSSENGSVALWIEIAVILNWR